MEAPHSDRPTTVLGISDATKIALGTLSSCALHPGGVRCWGYNNLGRLGDGTLVNRSTPVAVLGLTDPIDLGCALDSCCALERSGEVRCWGGDTAGTLGNGLPLTSSLVALPVAGPSDYQQIASGNNHHCGVTATNTLRCWGHNSQTALGDGTAVPRNVPVDVLRFR